MQKPKGSVHGENASLRGEKAKKTGIRTSSFPGEEGRQQGEREHSDNARILHLANLLKALSHPARLCIVKRLLWEGPCNVGYFTDCMGISQSGISQHLSKLRDMGIVEAKKQGTEAYYSLVDQDVINMIESFFREKNHA